MKPHHDMRRLRRSTIVCFLVALLAMALAFPSSAAPPSHAKDTRDLTVMTRNLYLGTDLNPLFDPETDLQDALASRWEQMLANDFPARAEALAAEIAEHRPHLVGLQEASLWRTGPIGGQALDVVHDFTAILLEELAAAGAPYRVAVSVDLFDSPPMPVLSLNKAIRLTDRQAILVRADANRDGLTVRNPMAGVFDARLELAIPGVPGLSVEVTRGWTSVDGKLRGQDFRFVNTHLEAFGPDAAPGYFRTLQAKELLEDGGPLDTDLPIVFVGDINSPAAGEDRRAGDVVYPTLLAGGPFTDVWSALRPDDDGLTCCYPDDLRDPDPTLRTRIDVVFSQEPFTPVSIAQVGDARVDGLWPSDHLGVVATLTIPNPGKSPRR